MKVDVVWIKELFSDEKIDSIIREGEEEKFLERIVDRIKSNYDSTEIKN